MGELTEPERAWLTGTRQRSGNVFWANSGGRLKAARCRQLIADYAHLIPEDRMPRLLRDIEEWGRASWD